MSEQKLNRAKVAGLSVNLGRLPAKAERLVSASKAVVYRQ